MDALRSEQPEPATQIAGIGASSEGPRERLWRLGTPALDDRELLAVLLGTGTRGMPVQQTAEALLHAAGGLKSLVTHDVAELAAMPGLGPARACALLAAVELGRRALRSAEKRIRLRSPRETYEHLAPSLALLRREHFRVVCVNARNVVLHEADVATGTVSHCPVDPREVFAPAIASRATGIIVAHNHPSGDPTPSDEDRRLTQRLHAAAELLSIRLLDHLVIGEGGYHSMLEERSLPLAAEPGRDRWGSSH